MFTLLPCYDLHTIQYLLADYPNSMRPFKICVDEKTSRQKYEFIQKSNRKSGPVRTCQERPGAASVFLVSDRMVARFNLRKGEFPAWRTTKPLL